MPAQLTGNAIRLDVEDDNNAVVLAVRQSPKSMMYGNEE
jgi:hypothetical protein